MNEREGDSNDKEERLTLEEGEVVEDPTRVFLPQNGSPGKRSLEKWNILFLSFSFIHFTLKPSHDATKMHSECRECKRIRRTKMGWIAERTKKVTGFKKTKDGD